MSRQQTPAISVKPLEWVEHGDLDFVWHRATPPIGPRYNIEDDGFSEKRNHLTAGQLVIGNYDTLDEAKAAAQADFDARIRSALSAQVQDVARPLAEYHEDSGPVVWWKFPVEEPSYIGCPNSSDWPGYHTHWTPHPPIPTPTSRP